MLFRQLVKLRGAGLASTRGDPWPCAARSVAVDDARDQAFVAAGSRVEIYNLQVHMVVFACCFLFSRNVAIGTVKLVFLSSVPEWSGEHAVNKHSFGKIVASR